MALCALVRTFLFQRLTGLLGHSLPGGFIRHRGPLMWGPVLVPVHPTVRHLGPRSPLGQGLPLACPADGDRAVDTVLWAPVNRARCPSGGTGVDSGVASVKSRFVVAGRSSRTAKGCPMNRADPLNGAIVSQPNPIMDVITDSVSNTARGRPPRVAEQTPCMVSMAGARRLPSPVRLTLASQARQRDRWSVVAPYRADLARAA